MISTLYPLARLRRKTLWAQLTAEVSVVLLPSSTAVSTVLGIGGPVCHTTKLVALGKRSVRDVIEHGLGGNRWAPGGALVLEGLDEVDEGELRHDERFFCWNTAMSAKIVNRRIAVGGDRTVG
jgi:hypothetical protein